MSTPMGSMRHADYSEYPVELTENGMFLVLHMPTHLVEVNLPHEGRHTYYVIITPKEGNVLLKGVGGILAEAVANAQPYCRTCYTPIVDGSGECPKCHDRQATIGNRKPDDGNLVEEATA